MRATQNHGLSGQALLLLLAAGASNPVLAAKSNGCGKKISVETDKLIDANITSYGGDRTYMYWVPPGYDANTASPLMVSMHGAGGSSEKQADTDRFTWPDFNTDHIVIYPQALETDGEILWEVSPEITTNDVGYVLNVLDQVMNQLCVDDQRVYATGMSQGGGMTNMLACDAEASKRFAAYAPVSGSYYYPKDADGKCSPDSDTLPCDSPQPNTPVLAFHGGDDHTIDYDGGERRGDCLPSIQYWISQWAERDGIDTRSTAQVKSLADGEAEQHIYGTGDDQGLVKLVFSNETAHKWPVAFGNPNDNNKGPTAAFNASSMIMDFFGKYTLADETDSSNDSSNDDNSGDDDQGAASRASTAWMSVALSGATLFYLSIF